MSSFLGKEHIPFKRHAFLRCLWMEKPWFSIFLTHSQTPGQKGNGSHTPVLIPCPVLQSPLLPFSDLLFSATLQLMRSPHTSRQKQRANFLRGGRGSHFKSLTEPDG